MIPFLSGLYLHDICLSFLLLVKGLFELCLSGSLLPEKNDCKSLMKELFKKN